MSDRRPDAIQMGGSLRPESTPPLETMFFGDTPPENWRDLVVRDNRGDMAEFFCGERKPSTDYDWVKQYAGINFGYLRGGRCPALVHI